MYLCKYTYTYETIEEENIVMTLRIGICDSVDEWHEKLEGLLQRTEYLKEIQYEIEHFYGEKELLQYSGEPMHLLFTDIVLKDGSGIALAGRVNLVWPECQVVYVTDEVSYALDVYQTEHIYFMLKNQVEKRIEEVLNKTVDKVVLNFNKANKRILLSVIGKGQILVSPEEIFYFERRKRTTVVVTSVGIYEIRDRLDDLQKILYPDEFIRCHISYIVHLSGVRIFEENAFLMKNGNWVPISRSYTKIVKKLFTVWKMMNVLYVN